MVEDFNIITLTAVLLLKFPQYRKTIISNFKESAPTNMARRCKFAIQSLIFLVGEFVRKAHRKMLREHDGLLGFKDVGDICMANEFLQRRLIDIGLNDRSLIDSLNKQVRSNKLV